MTQSGHRASSFDQLVGGHEQGRRNGGAERNWVRWRISRSRTRCCISRPCCSADLTATNRMVGHLLAFGLGNQSEMVAMLSKRSPRARPLAEVSRQRARLSDRCE
jgi:hypothetical protein